MARDSWIRETLEKYTSQMTNLKKVNEIIADVSRHKGPQHT